MTNYKINCGWDWLTCSTVILLFPTIYLQQLWNGFAIAFAWLNFEFSIEIRKKRKSKYEGIPFTGEAVRITKINESEVEEDG